MDQLVLYLDAHFQIIAAQGESESVFAISLEQMTDYTLPQLVPELALATAQQQLNETGQYYLQLTRMKDLQPQEWHLVFYRSPLSPKVYMVNLTVVQAHSRLGLTLNQQAIILQAMSEDQSALVLFYDLDCRILYANAYAQQCLGRSLLQLKGQQIYDVIDPNNVAAAKEQLEALSVDNPIMHHEHGHNLMGGEQHKIGGFDHWMQWSDRLIINEYQQPQGYLSIGYDITSRKRAELTIEDLANKDGLTGLYNRRYFSVLADQALRKAQLMSYSLAIFMLDVDYFKAINDCFGHAVGDKALIDLASILTSSLRADDIIARFGGEEFIVLLPHTPKEKAAQAAERICQQIAQAYFEVEHKKVHFTVSIGVGYSEQPYSLERLIKQADDALYRAKHQGRNRVCLDYS